MVDPLNVEGAPGHWERAPLGSFFAERRTQVSDKDYPPLSVTKSGVLPQLETAAKSDSGDNRKLVRVGDFAINSRSDRKGSGGLSPLDGSVSLIYTVLQPRHAILPKYCHYLLRSTGFQEEFYRWGQGIVADLWTTRYAQMRKIPLAVPPLPEQERISNYLDRETGRLDALVAEQENFITLLTERRKNIITETLDEITAPKASLRHFARQVSGSGFPIAEQGKERLDLAFYKVKALGGADSSGVLGAPDDTITAETAIRLGATVLPKGTIVFAKVGAALLLGRIGVMPVDGCVDNNMGALLLRSSLDPKFARHVLSTFDFDLAVQPGAVPSLDMEALRSFLVPVLPLAEQQKIADRLDKETTRLDKLIAEAKQNIEFSKERRAALITAAVTGQIEVD